MILLARGFSFSLGLGGVMPLLITSIFLIFFSFNFFILIILNEYPCQNGDVLSLHVVEGHPSSLNLSDSLVEFLMEIYNFSM